MTTTKKTKVAGETQAAKHDKQKAEMTRVDALSVGVEPRTLAMARPVYFYFEPLPARREAEKNKAENQIEVGSHQVDPNRSPSCVAVMPNLELMREIGNPYPVEADETCHSKPKWLELVPLVHAAFEVLKSKSEPATAAEIIEEAVAICGIGKKPNGDISVNAMEAVKDMLRDLRCYGIAASEGAGREFKKTKFQLVDGWQRMKIAQKGKWDRRVALSA